MAQIGQGICESTVWVLWLPIVDQFQTADWTILVEYPELVLQELQRFLRPLKT